jgi:hypothetical protein
MPGGDGGVPLIRRQLARGRRERGSGAAEVIELLSLRSSGTGLDLRLARLAEGYIGVSIPVRAQVRRRPRPSALRAT